MPNEKTKKFLQLIMDPENLDNDDQLFTIFAKYVDFDFDNILKSENYKLTNQEKLILK